MGIRRWFVWPPLVLAVVLAQSYFWVPTYDEQARGNPGRLEEFIHASIGDASILNPILAADGSSSEINNLVFEGLIDRDENLRFRGRVAESWAVSEEAYFYFDERMQPPGAPVPGPEGAAALLRTALSSPDAQPPETRAALANIAAVTVEPARTFDVARRRPAGSSPPEASVRVSAPPRVKLTLREVDQDLFPRLSELLGPGAFTTFDPVAQVVATPTLPAPELQALAAELLPATEHNPVIEFRLRRGLTFHDGHPVTARDVTFTYGAIMDPRTSPRASPTTNRSKRWR